MGGFPAGGGGALGSSLGVIPSYNLLPANFPNWRKAVANAQSGNAASRILCIGTSFTYGSNVSVGTQDIAAYLGTLLGQRVPAQPGMAPIPANSGVAGLGQDPRYSIGSGWSIPSNNIGWCANATGGGSAIAAPAASGALTFNAGVNVNVDSFDIWYFGNSATGTIQTSVNLVANTALATTQATPGYYKQTITFTAGTNKALALSTVSGTVVGVVIVGVEAYLSTALGLRVGQGGTPGIGTAANWLTSCSGAGVANLVAQYAPALVILELDCDDIAALPSIPAVLASTSSLIANIRAMGADVLLWTSPQLTNVWTNAQISGSLAYSQALVPLCASLGVGVVDISSRLGGGATAGGPLTVWQNNGFGGLDGVHTNKLGNADIAGALANALLSVA